MAFKVPLVPLTITRKNSSTPTAELRLASPPKPEHRPVAPCTWCGSSNIEANWADWWLYRVAAVNEYGEPILSKDCQEGGGGVHSYLCADCDHEWDPPTEWNPDTDPPAEGELGLDEDEGEFFGGFCFEDLAP